MPTPASVARGDVRVVQQVGEGEQLLVECYLEDE